jgi:O-antigen ligase
MGIKKRINITEILIYLYIIAFPFGHLLTLHFSILEKIIPLNISDIFSFIFLIIFLTREKRLHLLFIYFRNFIILCVFSQILFISKNGLSTSMVGLLYLLRLISYAGMFLVIWNYCLNKVKFVDKLFDFLIVSVFFFALFGWVQYFLYPDLRNLIFLGWDDHLFRMAGTLIDPTFTAIILVFGVLLSLIKYQKTKKIIYALFLVPILLALYFTYSRTGYLSLIFGLLTFLSINRKIRFSLILVPLFLIGIFLLPRFKSAGTELERTFSIKAKAVNYIETAKIFVKNPVFGVGYNNLCWARNYYLNDIYLDSHACSGSDSSILLLLSTTGIVGFVIFVSFLYMLMKYIKVSYIGVAFTSCLSSLFVHSIFSNSIFYPWVLGFLAILGALAIKE